MEWEFRLGRTFRVSGQDTLHKPDIKMLLLLNSSIEIGARKWTGVLKKVVTCGPHLKPFIDKYCGATTLADVLFQTYAREHSFFPRTRESTRAARCNYSTLFCVPLDTRLGRTCEKLWSKGVEVFVHVDDIRLSLLKVNIDVMKNKQQRLSPQNR